MEIFQLLLFDRRLYRLTQTVTSLNHPPLPLLFVERLITDAFRSLVLEVKKGRDDRLSPAQHSFKAFEAVVIESQRGFQFFEE